MSENLFYMQDSRTYVGNDVMWWAKSGNGYTTDLNMAEVYTQSQAQAMHNSRRTDIPWPKDYIDKKWRPAVDVQYIKKDEALEGTGIVLVPPPKQIKERNRCNGCGAFVSKMDFWAGNCKKCGADSRP